MNELDRLLQSIVDENRLLYAVLSGPRQKEARTSKVTVRPVLIGGVHQFQFESFTGKQAIQQNRFAEATVRELRALIGASFRQALLNTPDSDYQILISKKGKETILKKPPTRQNADRSPNRAKAHIIPDGEPCPFLAKLGVMNEDGKVLGNSYDKFRQINKFLEIISNCVPSLESCDPVNVVDFGCGKGYLTFAMHHYLAGEFGGQVRVTGVDRNESLVAFCNRAAEELGCTGLNFLQGDIQSVSVDATDLVVALHACDTATDEALAKAVSWQAKVILAAPCCQHELAKQIDNDLMKPLLKHGIIKERLAALLTDAFRANLLEQNGYTTQIMEFIDLEGTPKNLLIRAIRTDKPNEEALGEYQSLKDSFGVEPCLEELLKSIRRG